jgi:hypothetical protein
VTATMPEPPDRALVGLFHPAGRDLPIVLERDDTEDAERGEVDHWFTDDNAYTWPQVLELAAEKGWQVVRLYRADDPAVTGAFNAGVEAAVSLLEQFAESCKGVAYDGMWADVIAEARKAVKP